MQTKYLWFDYRNYVTDYDAIGVYQNRADAQAEAEIRRGIGCKVRIIPRRIRVASTELEVFCIIITLPEVN